MGSSKTHFTGAYSSVRCLRDVLHCDLPIEIWTYENEFKELPRTAVQAFLGIANVSIHTLKQPTHIKRPVWDKEGDWYSDYIGFSSMSRAIWTTTLEEVLAIDIDNVLFVHPDKIFNSRQFQETGTLFLWDKFLNWWPHYYPSYDPVWLHSFINMHRDRTSMPSIEYDKRPEFLTFFKSNISQHIAESSLVLFDKTRHRSTMAVLENITNRLGFELYSNIYGDKESYWIACELAGTPYAFNDWAHSHWGMMSAPIAASPTSRGGQELDKTVLDDVQKLSVCAGDEFLEPGALHYLPGDDLVVMSFNGCKQAGCAHFGMRKIKISPRFSYEKAFKMYLDKIPKQSLNASITSSTRTPVPKSAKNGRLSAGVQMLQDYWFKHVPCSDMNKEMLNMLLARRQYSLHAGKIYCSESGANHFCGKKNKHQHKKKGGNEKSSVLASAR